MRHRRQTKPRPIGATIEFLARDAIFTLRNRPRQRRPIARPAERHHLAVSDRADRLAHRLDVGRAHPADDRDVAIFQPRGMGRGLDLGAARLALIFIVGAVVDDHRHPQILDRDDFVGGDLATDEGLVIKLPLHRPSPLLRRALRAATRHVSPAWYRRSRRSSIAPSMMAVSPPPPRATSNRGR